MSYQDRRVEINISGIPVAGIGGLGLVAMAIVVAVNMEAAWWTMVAGLTGGVVLAVILVIARRHIKTKGPSGTDPTILFRIPPDGGGQEGGSHVPATARDDYPITRLRDYSIYSTR
jgi:hypothetical protein